MTFLAGDLVTAQRLNRLQPKPYVKVATGTLAGAVTNTDVPGCSITFTTETDGATVKCTWFSDFDLSGATTTIANNRLLLDSVTASDNFAMYAGEVTTDRGTVGNTWDFTIPIAGSHTIKVQASIPANMQMNIYTTLSLTVFEVV